MNSFWDKGVDDMNLQQKTKKKPKKLISDIQFHFEYCSPIDPISLQVHVYIYMIRFNHHKYELKGIPFQSLLILIIKEREKSSLTSLRILTKFIPNQCGFKQTK